MDKLLPIEEGCTAVITGGHSKLGTIVIVAKFLGKITLKIKDGVLESVDSDCWEIDVSIQVRNVTQNKLENLYIKKITGKHLMRIDGYKPSQEELVADIYNPSILAQKGFNVIIPPYTVNCRCITKKD